jgi:hypothetical protein
MIGYIYEITNATRSIVYVGSTTQTVEKRWRGHRSAYKEWLDGSSKRATSIYHHFKKHGIDSFGIEAIEEHEVESREQLLEFEQLVIDKTLNTCNTHLAYQPLSRNEYDKKRYAANHAHINEKMNCECGGKYTRKNYAVHARTKIHMQWLESS